MINCISARSTAGMFSLKDEYTLPFYDFLTIGLFISSAKCWYLELILVPV